MNRSLWSLFAFALGTILTAQTALAADGWGWNPFASKKTTNSSQSFSSYKQTSSSKSWFPTWKMPTLFNSRKTTNSYSQSNSTAWQRLSKTSKRWWTKTSETLSPYPSETNSSYDQQASSSKPKSSYFSGWFGKEQKKDEFGTVPDFLRQPMP